MLNHRFRRFRKIPMALLVAVFSIAVLTVNAREEIEVVIKPSPFGVIKGVVLDQGGKPISKATIAVFRLGSSKLLKEITATAKGRFFAKILPGTYTILAVAQGFNPRTLAKVEVNRADELVYGFKLERSGSGNTLPEKRADRNSAKSRIRAASARRSIYQNREGESPLAVDSKTVAGINADETDSLKGKGKAADTVIETFAATKGGETYAGLNFATARAVGENGELVFAGQVANNEYGPRRFETSFSFNPNRGHRVNLQGAISSLGKIRRGENRDSLDQVSFRALDHWNVREGIIVVVGIDYSRFIGAGSDFSLSPRLGVQYDLDGKTRIKSAYTTTTEPQNWQRVIEFEASQVLFREPLIAETVVVQNDQPVMNKNRRLEFGVERVLDNHSSVEANVFFDSILGRGVGFANFSIDNLGGKFDEFVANQQGNARGFRVVYSRRLNNVFSGSAGYAFGNGQKLSTNRNASREEIFEDDFFRTIFGEVTADFSSGTTLRTIYRLSPQATVFAIDPFRGRLAIFDPGLSILVTQNLPTWGLPIDAEAIFDAKNILDFRSAMVNGDRVISPISQDRALRGGILVRF